MRNKNLILIVLVIIHLSFKSYSQTNVKGGIYSNTTWTKANSPYIIIDTIVVFPGVTLTIEPGVIVKFEDNKFMEIRNAYLVAQGTKNDSITFTSNSLSPKDGIWLEINLKQPNYCFINYCNFRYAVNGISTEVNVENQLTIKNSRFQFNNRGIYIVKGIANLDSCIFTNNTDGLYTLYGSSKSNNCVFSYNKNLGVTGGYTNNCIISHNDTGIFTGDIINCIISYNNSGTASSDNIMFSTITNNLYGIHSYSGEVDNCKISNNKYGLSAATIRNCIIDSNTTGIFKAYNVYDCSIKHNEIGLILDASNVSIKYNEIEENNIGIIYSVQSNVICNKICNNKLYDLKYIGNTNVNLANNYWCSNDSVNIASHIFDGYDNIKYGLVKFLPLDTLQCYLLTGIKESKHNNLNINVSPNPASDYINIITNNQSKTKADIYDMTGKAVYSTDIKSSNSKINVSFLNNGLYLLKINTNDNITIQKIIVIH